jgi:tRNA-dihydrouridine synthase
MSFWDELPKPFFALAPMEDVTDVVFRQVVAYAGRPDVFMTEFMNVDGFCNQEGRQSVARRLIFSPTEQPIVAQIWGKDPEKFSLTAAELAKMGFAGVDINMGCPDKKVVKSGGGSALIARATLAKEIIEATRRGWTSANVPGPASPPPISVKTRLGYAKVDEWRPWLTTLLEQNLANLTVHLRTKKEMSKVPAHHELIPEIRALRDEIAPSTKLTVNGDIQSSLQGRTLQKKHPGVDGIMIGRGVFANPFCFTEHEPTRDELFDLLNYHLDLFDKHSQERKFDPLKRFFKVYIKDFPGAAELRAKLFVCSSTTEIRSILCSRPIRNWVG